ncbi:MAG: aspartate dehydrogenase [Lachnospiraceae bacterium]|nr:aspartate dehydrogenase [Lachnospiraceae bacterium]
MPYDPTKQTAVLKCSICNGEQVAGFQDIESGKFQEVMLIQNDADLALFRQTYGLTQVKKIY